MAIIALTFVFKLNYLKLHYALVLRYTMQYTPVYLLPHTRLPSLVSQKLHHLFSTLQLHCHLNKLHRERSHDSQMMVMWSSCDVRATYIIILEGRRPISSNIACSKLI